MLHEHGPGNVQEGTPDQVRRRACFLCTDHPGFLEESTKERLLDQVAVYVGRPLIHTPDNAIPNPVYLPRWIPKRGRLWV
ncbi:MAG: hypothetical protein WBG92_25150, partial [Thiohalocapsa sp.]